MDSETMKQVLFLCSSNYYRSRFAEHLFTHLAANRGLDWRADSRGLGVGRLNLPGQISSYALHGLAKLDIHPNGECRNPRQLSLVDLGKSDLVIAVKETEHRRMMMEKFPLWADLIEYWHIDDIDCAEPEEALTVLELQVRDLVDRLLARERTD
jgi:protein-tyrosine phosphatase